MVICYNQLESLSKLYKLKRTLSQWQNCELFKGVIKMFYTVGEMAKILNTTPSTLRYYDKEGLLPFVERSESGIRMFKDSDYEWLLVIDCLKNTGMGIKDIKKFIYMVLEGDATIKERLEMMKKQRESVKEQIAKLQQTLDTLNYKVWYYSTAEKAGTTSVPRNMPEEEVPEKLRAARRRLKLTHARESEMN